MTKYVKRLFFKERGRNRTKAFQPLKIKLASEVFFKGIIHHEMKIMSSFTHAQVVPTLYEFLSLTQNKIF